MDQASLNDNADSQPQINLDRLAAIQSLPAFPAVATKLLAVMADEDAGFREVSQLILTDTAMSGQVLRLANSSLFGFRQEVKSILRALCLMGANRVRDMLVTAALNDYIGAGQKSLLRNCWRHSVATAIWAETLAHCYQLDRPIAYTAGILHDLGRVALFRVAPDAYSLFLDRTSDSSAGDFRGVEQEIFGLDHCQTGGFLSRAWEFQPALTDIIGHHHDPVTPESPPARVLAQAACAAARMSGFCAAGPAPEWDPAHVISLLPPSRSGLSPALDDMRQQVVQSLNLIECSIL
jgi:putative nucleotidyltransferase with HDIG domain